MEPTRRQVIQSALAGTTLLAAGNEASAHSASAQPSGQWKTVTVSDKTQMRVYVVYPEGVKAKAPGVLVLQEIFGVNAHIRDVTQRIAALGYVAAAPELFHRSAPGFESGYTDMKLPFEHMNAMTDGGLEADLQATYDMLYADPQVDGARIGSVGYCMGGRASYIANALLPLKAAVSYYGGGIAKILPRAKEQHGAILLFSGGKDTHIGREQQNAIADALRAAGKSFVDVEFSDAEHGFFCDMRESYNAVAASESWALFTTFLRIHLGASG